MDDSLHNKYINKTITHREIRDEAIRISEIRKCKLDYSILVSFIRFHKGGFVGLSEDDIIKKHKDILNKRMERKLIKEHKHFLGYSKLLSKYYKYKDSIKNISNFENNTIEDYEQWLFDIRNIKKVHDKLLNYEKNCKLKLNPIERFDDLQSMMEYYVEMFINAYKNLFIILSTKK